MRRRAPKRKSPTQLVRELEDRLWTAPPAPNKIIQGPWKSRVRK